jgi:hypothetical protein
VNNHGLHGLGKDKRMLRKKIKKRRIKKKYFLATKEHKRNNKILTTITRIKGDALFDLFILLQRKYLKI